MLWIFGHNFKKEKNFNVQNMNERSLSSHKPPSPDKKARRRHVWHRVLDSKSENHSPFSDTASLCVVLGGWLWPVLGYSWDTFVSFLNLSPPKGRNYLLRTVLKLGWGEFSGK